MHIETQALHSGYGPDEDTRSTALPIYQSTAFAYETAEELSDIFAGKDAGYVYSRINNPTLDRFERRMTKLEGGLGAISCSSGMAAIASTILALAESGDEIIAGTSIFGGTYSLFARTLKRCGIIPRFVDSTDVEAYRDAITDKTKVIFLETIGNPRMDVPDLAAVSAVANEHGVALVADNTVATPILLRPAELGADIVIHSTSKFINGHGNAVGGLIVDCGSMKWDNGRYEHLSEYYARVRNFAFLAMLRSQVFRDLGCCSSPFNAFLMSIGVESLAVRMERHCDNAQALAEFLTSEKEAVDVRYPGLPHHEGYDVALKQFGGRFGAVLTFKLGSAERCYRFINELKLVKNLANLGDASSLVIHPASTICRDATPEQQEMMGVTADLIRMSVGLEHIDDIIDDVRNALAGSQ
jgi:O-acetylhomoserine (thiol)-lyase